MNFVDELDLALLGFEQAAPVDSGRPSYHPAVLLKFHIYSYLNLVQSSCRLERECQRNVELMWLVGHLTPDFKTTADFRHDNGSGIRNGCRRFVAFCGDFKLFSQALVAVGGSKFNALNTRDKNFTAAKIDKHWGGHPPLSGGARHCGSNVTCRDRGWDQSAQRQDRVPAQANARAR